MFQLDTHPSGRHFLQIPGPTNVPDRVLRAIDRPTIDHRGPEFARLTMEILDGLKDVFQTSSPIVTYAASGTGAWEAALVNTLSPGDRVLLCETGHFSLVWRQVAERLGAAALRPGGRTRLLLPIRALSHSLLRQLNPRSRGPVS
jgi:alanine-glyoxylate transaminase/serine-glyoxylate transaminase/serine-pyruvate transaminase